MSSAPSLRRAMILVVLLADPGCGKQDAPAANQGHRDASADAKACEELAKLYCENARVSCDETEQLLSGADIPKRVCADAARDFELLLKSLDASNRVLLPRIVSRHLVEVLLQSPSLSETQRAELEALTVEVPKPNGSGQRRLDAYGEDLSCPGVSVPKGDMPPSGTERWCERDTGLRHGPALTWNTHGELVRVTEYVDGKAVDVLYHLPQSQLLPPKLFFCPDGLSERRDEGAGSRRRWCVSESGVKQGPELLWEGERVVSASTYSGGEVVRWNMSPH